MPYSRSAHSCRTRLSKGFSLVELLTVIVVISIMAAASTSLIPSVLQSNQVNANVSNLAGIIEEAREAAMSSNTYVYVLFSNNLPTSPSGGIATIILESEDGTDSNALNNFTVTGSIGSISDLMVLHKLQSLPGIKLTASGAITSSTTPGISTLPSVSPNGASLAGASTPLNLTSNIAGSTYTFTQGIMFKPDGEAIASATTWNDLVEFGVEPIHQSAKDVAVMRLTRLTGKLTVYRQ